MLTSKERAELRAQANTLETTLMVGKNGVTEAVIAEAENLLTARELVKGKVLEGALMSAREVCDELCEATGADGVAKSARKNGIRPAVRSVSPRRSARQTLYARASVPAGQWKRRCVNSGINISARWQLKKQLKRQERSNSGAKTN